MISVWLCGYIHEWCCVEGGFRDGEEGGGFRDGVEGGGFRDGEEGGFRDSVEGGGFRDGVEGGGFRDGVEGGGFRDGVVFIYQAFARSSAIINPRHPIFISCTL